MTPTRAASEGALPGDEAVKQGEAKYQVQTKMRGYWEPVGRLMLTHSAYPGKSGMLGPCIQDARDLSGKRNNMAPTRVINRFKWDQHGEPLVEFYEEGSVLPRLLTAISLRGNTAHARLPGLGTALCGQVNNLKLDDSPFDPKSERSCRNCLCRWRDGGWESAKETN